MPIGVRIFVENDAVALFDTRITASGLSGLTTKILGPTDVAKAAKNPVYYLHEQPYNFLVRECKVRHFRTREYSEPLCTVSVTSPCIVFCAYTTEDSGVKSSGVYHAYSMPPTISFQERLYTLIDAVRPKPGEDIIVKAIGSDKSEKDLKNLRSNIERVLAGRKIETNSSHFLLGGPCRVTEFYPLSGELVTRLEGSEQKAVI